MSIKCIIFEQTKAVVIVHVYDSYLILIVKLLPEQRKNGGLSSTSNLTPSVEPEDGGFSNFEMTQGRQSTHSRRQKFAGIRNGSVNNIYARYTSYIHKLYFIFENSEVFTKKVVSC